MTSEKEHLKTTNEIIQEYAHLKTDIERIVDIVTCTINAAARRDNWQVKYEAQWVKYEAQWMLEEVIKRLQEKV